jgi:putative transposase
MTIAGSAVAVSSRLRRSHIDAAVVFWSATTEPVKKPDSVRANCEAIGLARSTYYYQSHRSVASIEHEQRIVLRLHELRELHPGDGYRRMTQQLQAEGLHVNRKRIARLMQLHGMTVKSPKPNACLARHSQLRMAASGTRKNERLAGPYHLWITGVSYVRIRSGLVYPARVIDAWTREVAGHAGSLQITSRLPRIALHAAVRAHRSAPGCIHHSTCGSQYLTRSYCELLREYGLVSYADDEAGRETVGSLPWVPASREILALTEFESWRDVVQRTRDFILAVYSRERVNQLLEGHTTESPSDCQIPMPVPTAHA